MKGAISKRGNKYARYILFNCSQMVVKLGASNYPEHPVYIYYQNKKAEGKHYYESLTACSTKILRMLYSMCKNNKQFLEKFFDIIDDSELMQNKENGNKRLCYYCFKSKEYNNIIWFIPISTKIDKYQKIYNNKIQKQKQLEKKVSIDTIVFGYVANTYSAFLNMFLVTEKYIESQYMKNKVPIKLSNKLQEEIIYKANKVLTLYNNGMKKIVFPNIDKILEKLLG